MSSTAPSHGMWWAGFSCELATVNMLSVKHHDTATARKNQEQNTNQTTTALKEVTATSRSQTSQNITPTWWSFLSAGTCELATVDSLSSWEHHRRDCRDSTANGTTNSSTRTGSGRSSSNTHSSDHSSSSSRSIWWSAGTCELATSDALWAQKSAASGLRQV
jgi:hypothetical protein